MAGNNNQQLDLIRLLIILSEALLRSLSLTAKTVSALSSMAREKKKREKKNGGKGDWVIRGKDFEEKIKELGDILQENFRYHAGDLDKPEENMTPEELKAHELRAQMLEETGQILSLDPKKGIRTRQEYEKYLEIKEYLLKDNLAAQKRNTKDLQKQKKDLLKNAEKESQEGQEQKKDQQKKDQQKNAEQKNLDRQELDRLQKEYERGAERLEALTAEQEKDLADREEREDEEDFQEFIRLNNEDDDEDKKEQEAEAREEEQKDHFHAAFQGAVKGAAGAVALGAVKEDTKSPYAMDKETMLQQQAALKSLLDENIKLRTGGLGYVVLNLGSDNMNPEQQTHAKNEMEARKFIDMDPDNGISDKEAYDAFMDVKNYFLEQNISYVKTSMNDNLGRQEAIRSTLQKENAEQRQEDAVDRQKRQNDPLAKPEANKNEKEIRHEAQKNERKLEERPAEQAKRPAEQAKRPAEQGKKPEIRRGSELNPPGIRREPTNYRELEREVAREDRRKNKAEKVSAMDRGREQLKKKEEVKKPKLPEEDHLKAPALTGGRKPKI